MEEAIRYYPNLLTTRMIVMPFMVEKHHSVIVMVNPLGVLDDDYAERGLSFMMLLDPSGNPKKKLSSRIAFRLRLFLNHLTLKHKLNNTGRRFTSKTFKLYTPRGEFFARL